MVSGWRPSSLQEYTRELRSPRIRSSEHFTHDFPRKHQFRRKYIPLISNIPQTPTIAPRSELPRILMQKKKGEHP
jgi:hypothetical protein